MEIKVGKFLLKSDRFCCWIEEEYKSQDGKNKGKIVTRQVAGYCTTIENLLNDFISKQIMTSEAESVKDLLLKIANATDEAKAIAIAAYKGNFKIVRNKEK